MSSAIQRPSSLSSTTRPMYPPPTSTYYSQTQQAQLMPSPTAFSSFYSNSQHQNNFHTSTTTATASIPRPIYPEYRHSILQSIFYNMGNDTTTAMNQPSAHHINSPLSVSVKEFITSYQYFFYSDSVFLNIIECNYANIVFNKIFE